MSAMAAGAELWQPAYVGLGSNLGDSQAMLERAIAGLGRVPQTRVVLISPFYRTRPFGPVDQGDFLNAAVALLTRRSPTELWRALRALEIELGRQPARVRWGPREIDLDLLVHGAERLEGPELLLPHPGISERDFVLYPLRDIAAAMNVPGLGRVDELAARVVNRGIEQVERT